MSMQSMIVSVILAAHGIPCVFPGMYANSMRLYGLTVSSQDVKRSPDRCLSFVILFCISAELDSAADIDNQQCRFSVSVSTAAESLASPTVCQPAESAP